MRNILIIPDFNSSYTQANYRFLKGRFDTDRLTLAPVSADIDQTFSILHKLFGRTDFTLIIGIGMGAFYAMTFCNVRKLLIDPPFISVADIKKVAQSYGFKTLYGEKSVEALLNIHKKVFSFRRNEPDERYGFNLNNTYVVLGNYPYASHLKEELKEYLNEEHVHCFFGGCYEETTHMYRGMIQFIQDICLDNIPPYRNPNAPMLFCPVCLQKTLKVENDFCSECGWCEELDGDCYYNTLDDLNHFMEIEDDDRLSYFNRVHMARKAYLKTGAIRENTCTVKTKGGNRKWYCC